MRKINDKKELIKLLSFIVMGDGGVYINKKSKNAYFAMNMAKKNEDYINLCKDILENITSCKKRDVDKGANRQTQVNLMSLSHPVFTTLRERIYTENYKGIDPHALNLLDYEALSFLYCSDGCMSKYKREKIGMKNYSYTITLNMKRLSYGDLFILKKALKEKLDLEWNINKQNKYYYLRLRTKDVKKFMTGIKPFIPESFSYKIDNEMLCSNTDGEIV